MNDKKKDFMFFPEWGWMIITGLLFAILVLMDVMPGHAAEIIPNGDLQDEECVLVSWDNSVFYAPELVFTTSLWDDEFPDTSVSYSYSSVENSRIYFHYFVEGEGTFEPDVVRFSVYNSAGNVLQDVWLDNGLSIYDYKVCRGSVIGWTNNLVYYNSSYGFSFADIDTLGYSGNVIYFCSILNNVEYYYAAQVRAGTFSLVHDSQSFETVLSSDSSAITLFSWDNSDREWVVISLDATEQTLRAYPVDRIIRLQGTSGIYLDYDAWARFDTRYFRDDVPASPTPDSDKYYFKFSTKDYYGWHYYMISFDASDFGLSCSFPVNDSFVSYIANQNSFDPSDFSGSAFVYRSGSSAAWNPTTYEKPALAFYFTSSGYSNFNLYSIPNATAYEYDPEVIAETYSPTPVGNSGYITTYDYSYSGLSCFLFSQALEYDNNYMISRITLGSVYGLDYTYQEVSSTASWYHDDSFYNLASGTENKTNFAYYGFLGLLGKLEDVDNPNGPTPTLAPTSTPEPTPSSTPIPSPGGTIYVVTPVPPTPPVDFVPYDPGSVSLAPLKVETFESVTEQLPSQVNGTTAKASLGFLGFLMGFLPAEALWFLWFILFILVVLAIVRLFIHFTGG